MIRASLNVERLESRECPANIFEGQSAWALGTGIGQVGTLTWFSDASATLPWRPFGTGYTSGFRVATADLNNDGYRDLIAGTGPGVLGTVLVYDGQFLLKQTQLPYPKQTTPQPILAFQPYGSQYMQGIFVGASAGRIVTGTDVGALPQVNVYGTLAEGTKSPGTTRGTDSLPVPDGMRLQLLSSFYAYPQGFLGGVRLVSLGYEVLTAPGEGGQPYVSFWTEQGKPLRSVAAFGGSTPGGYRSGLNLASLDEEPTPFPGNPTQDKNAHKELWAVSTEKEGALVALWDRDNVSAFYAHSFPFGTRVGLSLQYVEQVRSTVPVLSVAFANTASYVRYEANALLQGSVSPFLAGFIPPGSFVLRRQDNGSNDFVPAMGGWIG